MADQDDGAAQTRGSGDASVPAPDPTQGTHDQGGSDQCPDTEVTFRTRWQPPYWRRPSRDPAVTQAILGLPDGGAREGTAGEFLPRDLSALHLSERPGEGTRHGPGAGTRPQPVADSGYGVPPNYGSYLSPEVPHQPRQWMQPPPWMEPARPMVEPIIMAPRGPPPPWTARAEELPPANQDLGARSRMTAPERSATAVRLTPRVSHTESGHPRAAGLGVGNERRQRHLRYSSGESSEGQSGPHVRRHRSPSTEYTGNSSDSERGRPRHRQERRRYMVPDKYDGKTMEWADYLVHFNIISEVNGWHGRDKAMQLAGSLVGRARHVLSGLPVEEYTHWGRLVARLAQAFDPPHQEEAHRTALRMRCRKKEETPQEFGQDLELLSRRAYPQLNREACNTLALDYFMRAQPEGELRLIGLLKSPRDVREAANFVAQYESARIGRVTKPLHLLQQESAEGEVAELIGAIQGEISRQGAASASTPGLTNLGQRLPYFKGLFEVQDKKADKMLELLTKLLTMLQERKQEPIATGAAGPVPRAGDPRAGPRTCWECQGEGHLRRDCPKVVRRTAALEQLAMAITLLRSEEEVFVEEENIGGLP